MFVDVRFYKRFDADLISLIDAGYPVAKMIKQALVAHVCKMPLRYDTSNAKTFDMNRPGNARVRVSITDDRVGHLLNNIKHGYRSSFCKCLLRNVLDQQNFTAYIASNDLIELYGNRRDIEEKNLVSAPEQLNKDARTSPPVIPVQTAHTTDSSALVTKVPSPPSLNEEKNENMVSSDKGEVSGMSEEDSNRLLSLFDNLL